MLSLLKNYKGVKMKSHYKNFPQINELINEKEFVNYPKYLVKHLAKELISNLKQDDINIKINKQMIIQKLLNKLEQNQNNDIIKVINATGVVLHTNLGRSLIDEDIYDNSKDLICSYTNLEFDLNTGKRGDRYEILCKNISMLFGSEDALVVNNNAAAVFLVLNTFAKNKFAITSRSELVEIGGSFRVSEVMKNSGAKLYEIGTSNKTHLKDYELALSELKEEEKIILKTHKSNFYQEGFVLDIDAVSLQKFCDENNVEFYYDLGGGSVDRLKNYKEEISIKELVKNGVKLLSFSGDKLFSSVQSGIILGTKKHIKKLKQNQILRMLRISKVEIVFLNECVKKYLQNQNPTSLKMLNDSLEDIKLKASKTYDLLNQTSKQKIKLVQTSTLAGAGSVPKAKLDSYAFLFDVDDSKALLDEFRKNQIIGKLINKKLYLDFRSIKDTECEILAFKINKLFV